MVFVINRKGAKQRKEEIFHHKDTKDTKKKRIVMPKLHHRKLCLYCKHFDSEAWDKDWRIYRCKAFPEGIQDLIWNERWDHRERLAQDNNIQFELQEDLEQL